MRYLLTATFITFSFFIQVPAVSADIGGLANGSSCDLSGAGSGGGRVQDGQCVSPSLYQSQSSGVGIDSPGVALINPLNGGGTLEGFLTSILSFVIRIGAIVVVLMLVYVGYLFVVARGNDSKLTEARRALLWTVVGALILLGAQTISIAIQQTVSALSVGR